MDKLGSVLEDDSSIEQTKEVINSYLQFCVDNIIPTKNIKVYGNTKPWVDRELRNKFKEKSCALKNGDYQVLHKVQQGINSMVKTCKRKFRLKIEEKFKSNDTKTAWQGLKSVSGYSVKKKDSSISVDIVDLNKFYAGFDDSNNTRSYPGILSYSNTGPITFSPEEILNQFCSVNPYKATGPDGVSSTLIKHCARQLCNVFCGLFNRAMVEHIPLQWN